MGPQTNGRYRQVVAIRRWLLTQVWLYIVKSELSTTSEQWPQWPLFWCALLHKNESIFEQWRVSRVVVVHKVNLILNENYTIFWQKYLLIKIPLFQVSLVIWGSYVPWNKYIQPRISKLALPGSNYANLGTKFPRYLQLFLHPQLVKIANTKTANNEDLLYCNTVC